MRGDLLQPLSAGGHRQGLLYIDRKNLYCMGDNQNDLSMLALSAIPFAPANCARPVRDWGARILGHCDDHAVAQAIQILDSIY